MEMTLSDTLSRASKKFPEKEAVVCEGMRITFKQLDERVDRLANGLIGLGVEKGAKVAILLENSIEYIECLFGINRAGGISVPINSRFQPKEVQGVLNHSQCRILIYGDSFSGVIDELRSGIAIKHYVNVGDGLQNIDYFELRDKTPAKHPLPRCGSNDIATILFTSGTTSEKPKGAVLTHNNHIWSCNTFENEYGLTPDDIVITAIPMFHTGGLHRCLGAVFLGCTNIIMPKFTPLHFLELIQKERVSHTLLVPTMFTMIETEVECDRFDTSTMRVFFTGAARTQPELIKRIQVYFPNANICMSYGCTECFTVVIIKSQDIKNKPGSIGLPIKSAEVRVCDEQGETVSQGTTGEIWIKGPSVAEKYFDDPEATEKSFCHGWFKTGDLARVDGEGFIYLVDRKKDIIISGGENISSIEVENTICTNEKVVEAAVIGVPDKVWGESVRALVVPKTGTEITEQEIIDFCRNKLAGYKRPKSVVFLDELPKNASNKVLKRELRARYGK